MARTKKKTGATDVWVEHVVAPAPRVWAPALAAGALDVHVDAYSEASGRKRAFFRCTVLTDTKDTKGNLAAQTPLTIFESSGLRDLNQFVGCDVRIVPAGNRGRTRVYRFYTREQS